jgi:3-hydroxymyristoyl/3-hydroxydecanoyl-(acyl carrier protein) dehydratase
LPHVGIGNTDWRNSKTMPDILQENWLESTVVLELEFPPEMFQFQGHFREYPVMPGVAQLDIAIQLAQRYFKQSISLSEVTHLKFKKVIPPETILTLTLTTKLEKSAITFEYGCANGVVSSGVMKLRTS